MRTDKHVWQFEVTSTSTVQSITRELNKRRDTYRTMVRDALSDGVVDHEEHRVLRDYSQGMGIEDEEAISLLKQESRAMLDNSASSSNSSNCCPHCGKPVTKDA